MICRSAGAGTAALTRPSRSFSPTGSSSPLSAGRREAAPLLSWCRAATGGRRGRSRTCAPGVPQTAVTVRRGGGGPAVDRTATTTAQPNPPVVAEH